MERDQIIRMAREAGDLTVDQRGRMDFSFDEYGLERFTQLVAAAAVAAEREACAKVCDEYTAVGKIEEFDRGWLACARTIASVIRSRGNT